MPPPADPEDADAPQGAEQALEPHPSPGPLPIPIPDPSPNPNPNPTPDPNPSPSPNPNEAPELLDAAALRAMDEAALEDWVGHHRLPVFAHLDRDNFWEATQNEARPLAVLLLDPCEGKDLAKTGSCTTILQSDAGTKG